MNDDQKVIEEAAEHYDEAWGSSSTHADAFKDGVKWRDKNPSPEVLALIEATTEAMAVFTETDKMKWFKHLGACMRALEALK